MRVRVPPRAPSLQRSCWFLGDGFFIAFGSRYARKYAQTGKSAAPSSLRPRRCRQAFRVHTIVSNDEESSVRLALELGSKPLPDKPEEAYKTLDAAWKRVQGRPPPADVDASGLSAIPAAALAAALQAKVANAPAGAAKGQMLNALSTFMRVSQPWLTFEGR